jgi:transposase-like protein/DDE family transposase
MSVVQNNETWAEELFSECDLGDKRRTKRLIKVASDLAGKVGKSLSTVCQGDDAALEGGYRLIRNESVQASAIGEGGYCAIAKKAKECELLLAIEDTTTLSYYHEVVEELGDIGGGGKTIGHRRGFFAHSILLVDAHKKQTIGLVEQNFWKRDEKERGKKHERDKRPYEEKESYKWEAASQNMVERLGEDIKKTISVCDREADIYEYLFYKSENNQRFIVRAGHNRKLAEIDENLIDAFKNAPKLGTYDLFISQKSGRKARTTKIDVHSCSVEIRKPKDADGEPLKVNMVVAIEAKPENSQEAISWVLLTMEPVRSYEEAKQIISYYAMRWRIEEFHKAWKTGAGAERQRMQSADNLERMLVILSFVAVRLFQLREALESEFENNREVEDIPCTTVLTEEEYKVLWYATHKKGEKKKPLPKRVPNLNWAYREIAKLGGWCNSKKTGRASWLTIWHGWFRLQDRLEGYFAAQM